MPAVPWCMSTRTRAASYCRLGCCYPRFFPPLQWCKPDDAVGGIEEAKGYRRTGEPTFKAVLGLACGAVAGSSFSELGISITEVHEAGFQLASCANMRALMKFFGLSPKAIPRMDMNGSPDAWFAGIAWDMSSGCVRHPGCLRRKVTLGC